MEFVEEYEGILPNTPRSYGRVCCICGTNDTYSYNGTPVWAKYKDDSGEWTGEWVCHNCQERRKGHKFKKLKKCRICGSEQTRQSNGRHMWTRDIDINGKWTGEYLCYTCVYENKLSCGHKRTYKVYDGNGGKWTGKRKCSICESKIESQSQSTPNDH